MRADHYAPPRKWINEYRRAIRIGDTAFKLYCYCENGIESHRTGLYFVTAESIATMIAEEPETVESTFDDLETVGLVFRDQPNELVYVPSVCDDQFRWKSEPKGNDWRVVEARRHIAALPHSPLVAMFLERWPIFTPDPSPFEGPSKPQLHLQ